MTTTLLRSLLVAVAATGALTFGTATAAAGPEYVANYEIRLAPGTNETTIDDAVVRGTSNFYDFEARAGQALFLATQSVEENAVLTLIAPDGTLLYRETTWIETELPQSGVYTAIVSSTRGNADYRLHLGIY